ncbi:glycosyltransferase [Streptacidiphilus melanogenes]|uniref:glycosyltransferase n=1 Tax=Streptacidiphilus melanogenes TaxID=411235 RepID=UPI0005AA3C0A|nr:glycosyltransferase [Streptacidiphilus melanogenes]
MRILTVTAGSRRDVAPFTGLGQRLLDAGHQVAVAAHEPFAALVAGCGLAYRPLPGNPQELIRARALATSPQEARAVTAAFLDRLADGVVAAVAADTDVVLTAFGPASLSQAAAEAFAIPVIGAYLAPAFATREFPLPGTPGADDLGADGNLAAGRALLAQAGTLQQAVLARLRARLGLPAAEASTQAGRLRPVFHGFSPLVVPRPADWPSGVEVAGYWWPARPRGWRPPAELVDFLQAGPPPVFVGFGSMAPDQGERLGEPVAAAAARAGVRRWCRPGGPACTTGDDVLPVGDLPPDWLFPHTAAVVHHAGAGTTAAGLRAGVPAVAVPVMADQPFWAARLQRLGVAPRPLPFHELTAEALAEAITACVADPAHGQRAVELARRIAAEDGAAAVLAHVGVALDG